MPIKDRFNVVYFTQIGVGMSMLFGFNSFIAAPEYVKEYYKFASGDENAKTDMPDVWNNIMSYISVMTMIPNLICQVFIVMFGRRFRMQPRLIVSMWVLMLSLIMVPLLPLFKVNEKVALGVLLTCVGFCGAGTAFFQSTGFALTANFPEKYTQGVMFGIGVSGSLICLVRIIMKASFSKSYQSSQIESRVFFGIAVGFMLISHFSIILMKYNRFAQKYVPEYLEGKDEEYKAALLAEDNGYTGDATSGVFSPGSPDLASPALSPKADESGETSGLVPSGALYSPEASMTYAENNSGAFSYQHSVSLAPPPPRSAFRQLLYVIKTVFMFAFINFLTYFITLTVFPGVAVAISKNSWFGVIIVFLFNLGDTVGRFTCQIRKLWMPHKAIPFAGFGRLLFVPFFFLCVFDYIPGKVFPQILMFITGVTNGFVSSQCMMFAPALPKLGSNEERAAVGNTMSFSLLAGCSAGSLLALLICAHLPNS